MEGDDECYTSLSNVGRRCRCIEYKQQISKFNDWQCEVGEEI
jgi:hypothetical protein